MVTTYQQSYYGLLESYLLMMTFRQKDLILKSLKSTGRRKVINAYCGNLDKSWLDLDIDEASELIEKLVKLSWN